MTCETAHLRDRREETCVRGHLLTACSPPRLTGACVRRDDPRLSRGQSAPGYGGNLRCAEGEGGRDRITDLPKITLIVPESFLSSLRQGFGALASRT